MPRPTWATTCSVSTWACDRVITLDYFDGRSARLLKITFTLPDEDAAE